MQYNINNPRHMKVKISYQAALTLTVITKYWFVPQDGSLCVAFFLSGGRGMHCLQANVD